MKRLCLTLLVLLFATLAQAAPPPLAQTLTGTAKSDYEAGKLLFTDGDFVGANIKFRAAYDLSHDARLLWNMAACEKNLRHYAVAARLVHEYVDTGGDLLGDQDRADAAQLLAALQSFVVKLTVTVNEPGAEIDVDDARAGVSPLDKPLILDLGERKIVVKKPGFKEATKSITLGANPEEKIDVTLVPEVHEGTLVVTTAPGARVLLDGAAVGTGGFRGKLKSGGHTLRVEATGMQPMQQEVVVEDGETRTVDVPLAPIVEAALGPKPPSYRGFYGRVSTPFWFGFGGSYEPPAGLAGSELTGGIYGLANLKLAVGDAFGWFRVEGVVMGMFGGRFDSGGFADPSGNQVIKIGYPMLSGFAGVGARVTSLSPSFRVTGGVALGGGPHQILDGNLRYGPCDNSGNGNTGMSCSGNDGKFNPGWGSFAMTGDLGVTIGNGSPGARFFVGVDWYVDFPPDVVVGPFTGSNVPSEYVPKNSATMVHGPQFYIGPSLGVGFGH